MNVQTKMGEEEYFWLFPQIAKLHQRKAKVNFILTHKFLCKVRPHKYQSLPLLLYKIIIWLHFHGELASKGGIG
ncbi:MAG: hypothetical protein A2Y71_10655 [Bacteroidetes bacterium RBG_13_42_15]|nr:MAG: hypothetical protein A2Y71_10655 [Bacteroidetes bacterium RBG_13_42_15]